MFARSGSYHPLRMRADVQSSACVLSYERSALVDHERADVDVLALERPARDLRVLLVEVCNELGAVVAAIALCRKNEPESKQSVSVIQSGDQSDRCVLAALELGEFLALEEDLEGSPDSRCCSERAVDIGRTIREARPDGLINVNNWKVHNLEIGKWSHAASPAYHY